MPHPPKQQRIACDLCQELIARREALGMTQAEAGRLIERSQQWVQSFENRTRTPPWDVVEAYAAALGLRVNLEAVAQ